MICHVIYTIYFRTGTFKAANGSNACMACPEATYSGRSVSSTMCNDCPLGSFSPPGHASSIFDCTCRRGYHGENGSPCTPCGTGKYKAELGPGTCTDCGRGWYSSVVAAVNSSFCAPCAAGKFTTSLEAATADDCSGCAAGKYAAGTGNSACDECTGGKYSVIVAATSGTVCVECIGGRYSGQGSSVCLQCSPGTYSLSAAVACTLCPPDFYNPLAGASSCLNCTTDFCANGQFRTKCRGGATNDGRCVNCTVPKAHTMFISHGSFNDTCDFVCEPPYKEDCLTGECKLCDPGTYSAESVLQDRKPHEMIHACRACPEGGQCDGSEVVVCGFDRYLSMPDWPIGATVKKCEKCPLGAMCIDGSCALKNVSFGCPPGDATELAGIWNRQPYNDPETAVNPEHGRYELASCPPGYSKKSLDNEKATQAEFQKCQRCNSEGLHYILDPDTEDCQRCPPGLQCHGDNVTVPVTEGSEWSVQSPILRLTMCPTGYKIWPELAPGEEFDNDVHAPIQECQACSEGTECTLERCSNCTLCPPGTYKDSPGTIGCRKCAAGKYNTKKGQKSETDCIRCVDGSNTGTQAPFLEGATSINDCDCAANMYMSINRTGPGGSISMRCFTCPAAATCPDGACGLRSPPHFACTGIVSSEMKHVLGSWIRGPNEMYRLIGCPTGHKLINGAGYELQECFKCQEGKYISDSNDPSAQCFNCPPSGICPNGGKPIFPDANMEGEVKLLGPAQSSDGLTNVLAISFGVDSSLIKILDYFAPAVVPVERRTEVKRRATPYYIVRYKVFGDSSYIALVSADTEGMLANLTNALQQTTNGNVTIYSAEVVSTTSRLPGELWEEVDGVFTLRACPVGYLLVNTTTDTQGCFGCEPGSYSLDMFAGCSGGTCGQRSCAECPVGAECKRGSNPPWMHFLPKLLKIGQRTVEWATITGVTAGHQLASSEQYELHYDNITGMAYLGDSEGQNLQDYVWEYVAERVGAIQSSDPAQVPGFYLRKCPHGSQLINTSFGGLEFDLSVQQCVPCGPLNYIVDPNSGGSCQECPKGAFCPDGNLFVPNPLGSEWEIVLSGLDAVKRVVTCPPGFYRIRNERYPLEDQCLRCDANTYLLDQSNFSECLNCPVGASCSGGDDVSALVGFWREPENWTTPGLASKNGRRVMNSSNITHRPRAAKVHKCPPSACGLNNQCKNNRTGPACGLCPQGWAMVAAGCEWCPASGDPAMITLQITVFVGGGIFAFLGYILACWTPLMGSISLPKCMVRGIFLWFGIDPDEQEEDEEKDEKTNAEGIGIAVEAGAAGSEVAGARAEAGGDGAEAAGPSPAGANTNTNARDEGGEGEPRKNKLNQLILKLREIWQNVLRFKPTQAGGGLTNIRTRFEAFVDVMGRLGSKLLAPLSAVGKSFFQSISSFVKGITWLTEFAEKHKLKVHLKILVSYVQVLSSFATFNVEWPEGLTSAMNDVGTFFEFNWVQLPKLACLWAGLSFEVNLIAMTVGPLIFVAFCGLPLVVCKITASRHGWTADRLETWDSLLDSFYGNVLFGAFLVYPIVSKESLQAFNCHQTLDILFADFTRDCPSSFSFLRLYSAVCVFLYPLGIPFAFYSLMISMKIPEIAKDKTISAGFSDMIALFNKMNETLECKLIAQMIGKVDDDADEVAGRIEEMYR